MKKTEILAIIPARGGSKRIKRKNIKLFLGSPIIAYVIQAARKSRIFSEIMVSTEDKEIAEIAEKYRATVPFYRSKKNAGDTASTIDVINEVLDEYAKLHRKFTYFCCIYPAAPFVTPKILTEALNLLKKTKCDAVFPVAPFSYPIQRALRIKDSKLSMIDVKNLKMRSQDLEPAYHDCGQFYFVDTEKYNQKKAILTGNTRPIIISELDMQDIDNPSDWEIAELKYKLFKKGNKK